MNIYGIFGDPIGHSLSPAMQNAAFRYLGLDACYLPFTVKVNRLKDAILGAGSMGFSGVNLTTPLKERALEIVQPDTLAKAIGAVNTVSFGRDVVGHNTDGLGAFMALEECGVHVKGSKVLLVGAGGSARAIAYTLAHKGAEMIIINRTLERARELASHIGGRGYGLDELELLVPEAKIIINATSLGMMNGDPRLFDGKLLHRDHVVFDIVYNRQTELLRDAFEAGALAIDGVMMLVYQGAKALEIWTGLKAPVKVMEDAVRAGLRARG